MSDMDAYQHLIGKKGRWKVGERVISSLPGKEEVAETWRNETVVALSSVATAAGSHQGEYAVMESGERVPLDKVFIETILFGQPEEAA